MGLQVNFTVKKFEFTSGSKASSIPIYHVEEVLQNHSCFHDTNNPKPNT